MNRADDIQNEQSKLKKELDKIQERCHHEVQHIKYDYNKMVHMWRCNKCKLNLRYPTDSELDEYIKA